MSTPHLLVMNTTLEQHKYFIQYLLPCHAELPDCLSSSKKQNKGEITKSSSEKKNYKDVTSQSPFSCVEQTLTFLQATLAQQEAYHWHMSQT